MGSGALAGCGVPLAGPAHPLAGLPAPRPGEPSHGPRVAAGRDATPYTHYSLLRSIEAAFGLPSLGHAGGTATIPEVATRTG